MHEHAKKSDPCVCPSYRKVLALFVELILLKCRNAINNSKDPPRISKLPKGPNEQHQKNIKKYGMTWLLLLLSAFLSLATPFWLCPLSRRLSLNKPIAHIIQITVCKVEGTRFKSANHLPLPRQLSRHIARMLLSHCFRSQGFHLSPKVTPQKTLRRISPYHFLLHKWLQGSFFKRHKQVPCCPSTSFNWGCCPHCYPSFGLTHPVWLNDRLSQFTDITNPPRSSIYIYMALYMALNPSQSIISIHFHWFPMFGKSCLKILVDRCSTCFNRLGLAWQLIDDRIYRATCFFSPWPRHATMVPGPIFPAPFRSSSLSNFWWAHSHKTNINKYP